jgi:hypothetical protein
VFLVKLPVLVSLIIQICGFPGTGITFYITTDTSIDIANAFLRISVLILVLVLLELLV